MKRFPLASTYVVEALELYQVKPDHTWPSELTEYFEKAEQYLKAQGWDYQRAFHEGVEFMDVFQSSAYDEEDYEACMRAAVQATGHDVVLVELSRAVENYYL